MLFRSSEEDKGSMAAVMLRRPVNRMLKPKKMVPNVVDFLDFSTRIITMPTMAAMGASVDEICEGMGSDQLQRLQLG